MYTFIAYKPNSADVRMGHVLESYDSDHKLCSSDDIEHDSWFMAELVCTCVRNMQLGDGEDGYEITILKDGDEIYSPSYTTPCGLDIFNDAMQQAKLIVETAAREKEEEMQRQQQQHLLALEVKERELFEQLKNKFGY